MKLLNLENGLYCVQSDIFLTKVGHKFRVQANYLKMGDILFRFSGFKEKF